MSERQKFHKFALRLRNAGVEEETIIFFKVDVDGEFREPQTWEEAQGVFKAVGIADPRQEPVLVELSEVRTVPVDLKLATVLCAENPELYNNALVMEADEKAKWDGPEDDDLPTEYDFARWEAEEEAEEQAYWEAEWKAQGVQE